MTLHLEALNSGHLRLTAEITGAQDHYESDLSHQKPAISSQSLLGYWFPLLFLAMLLVHRFMAPN